MEQQIETVPAVDREVEGEKHCQQYFQTITQQVHLRIFNIKAKYIVKHRELSLK